VNNFNDLTPARIGSAGQPGRPTGQGGRTGVGHPVGALADRDAQALDAGTIGHIKRLGLLTGWRCAEIGAGGASVARWLAERLRQPGHVVAADADTRALERFGCEGLEIRRHDILTGPLDEASYDFVHTRLLLTRLPDGLRAVKHMVACLRPGGWLLAEDFDMGTGGLELAGLKGVQVEARRIDTRLMVAAWGQKPAPFL
jgi:SAM-dependent methyltransferase